MNRHQIPAFTTFFQGATEGIHPFLLDVAWRRFSASAKNYIGDSLIPTLGVNSAGNWTPQSNLVLVTNLQDIVTKASPPNLFVTSRQVATSGTPTMPMA